MTSITTAVVWILISYLIGCFSTAYYLHLWITGKDIRSTGSGNAGARNAGRVLGTRAFVIVLLLDVGKGALAVLGAQLLGASLAWQGAALVAVVAGHNFPVQLRFRGGKGNATALGALLVLDPPAAAGGLLLAAALLAVTRRGAVSGALAVVFVPAVALLLRSEPEVIVALTGTAILSVVSHVPEIREYLRRRHERIT